MTAVVGVPVRFSVVVVLDTLALTPAGSGPDAIVTARTLSSY
jgi:hypothetical protein